MDFIRDKYERVIDYMRISITDRCNLRCVYCMPSEGVKPFQHKDVLSYEEMIRVVKIAANLGVRKIRITGGEPLIRRNLIRLIEAVSEIQGIDDLSLTTNGQLLKKYAHSLASAGLRRVNVSLDSLKPDRYREITRGGDIGNVLEGIWEAEKAGLAPIKINMIPIKGINDDEIEDFACLTLTTPFHVRFIELMPFGLGGEWCREKCIPTDEIKKKVSTMMPLFPVKIRKSGPARYFGFEDAQGIIGFISSMTHHFCGSCNRLRLTSDGKLKPCLFSQAEIDLRSAMRSGASDGGIERLLKLSVEIKPQKHAIRSETCLNYLNPMSRVGG